jgi:dihydroorotate dehydrogenase
VKLLGIEFGRVFNASGARNFHGDGYPYHRWLGPLAPHFGPATFVAKTTTVEPRAGNMPLRGTTPTEFKPRCIAVNFRKAAVLNAVGLSGPGLTTLLDDGRWQDWPAPFFLSFMAVEKDPLTRLASAGQFAHLVAAQRPFFRSAFGVQVNFSCPNVGMERIEIISDVCRTLSVIADHLPGVPLVPKFNVLTSVGVVREIAAHEHCAAVSVSNTIPWGSLPDRIDWRGLFGRGAFGKVSPLVHLGGGGLSGAPLLPLVAEWVNEARCSHFPLSKPIVAGGGIMSGLDAAYLLSMGAAAVELGSVVIVRPWRVAGIVLQLSRSRP